MSARSASQGKCKGAMLRGRNRSGREGVLVVPLDKISCTWDGGVCLGVLPTTGEFIVGDKRGVWPREHWR